jgi:cytochrome c-type biogenesis protein CcmH
MTVLLLAIFAGVAAGAIGFAVWPILRGRGGLLLGCAIAALVVGLGFGAYMMLGSPALALRTLTGPSDTDIRGLVAVLAQRVRQTPNNPRGWTLLGRGYLSLNDPSDAAAAFRRALMVTPPVQRAPLFSSYGEALTLQAGGAVPPEAEAAFTAALRLDPADRASRFYLGQLYSMRGDHTRALGMWNRLLAETDTSSPLHNMLVDRMAMLSGQSGAAPDVQAMVAGLAARLKTNPRDAQGWLRLMRAYSVLGDKAKAQAALAEARTAFKSDAASLKAFDAEAKADRLQK